MTRLDSSPPQGTESSWMDERRGRNRSRQASESWGDRGQESGYFSPDRRGDGEQQTEEAKKRQFRYYERGHPLPSNYVPEPKACVPYRNVNLGVPSQRRNQETYMQETWRSESPQRYTYHSNFRRGDSQRNSPTRHSSMSPERYNLTESPVGARRGSSVCRSQTRSHTSSHSSPQLPSYGPSCHTSGWSSPSCRKGSTASRTASPSRATPSHRRAGSLLSQNGEYDAKKVYSRESGSPSQASNRHSLDSEKLYRNLESISRRGSSALQQNSYELSQPSPRIRTAVNSLTNTRTRNSRDVSPSRNGYGTSHSPQRQPCSRDSRLSPQNSWQGSAHSLLSIPASPGSSSSRRGTGPQVFGGSLSQATITGTDEADEGKNKVIGDRSRSAIRRGMDTLLISEPKKAAVDAEEVGMTIDDYIVLADIPKIQVESEEEFPGLRLRNQSPSPCRDQRLRTYRYQDEIDRSSQFYSSRPESDERGRGRERGRDRREKCRDSENGRSSRRRSAASLHTQGWMSRLDEHGKWRKHWFVLGDTSLRYYRDSEAEESDDLDGEIELTSCVNVSDCDVDKNYGLQIQTKGAVFTLSAVTSRIRKNWLKLLKQAIQNNTHQSDIGSEKENPLSRRPSPCQPRAQFTCKDSGYEPATCTSTTTAANSYQTEIHHQAADRDLGADLSPASQREEGEGWDREQAKRLEERNKWFEEGHPVNEMGSRDHSPPQEVNQSVTGSQTNTSNMKEAPPSINGSQITMNTAEALQKEAVFLQKQVESIKRERAAMGIEVESPCGTGAPCRARLEAMEVAHRKALQELQEKHAKEIKKLEEEKDRMLQEESQAAAKAMEALRTAHREELERQVEKARKSFAGAAHVDSSCRGQALQADVLHSELDVLSERYSQKCLELDRTEQSSKSRETELGRKEKELEQLRRENQDLKAKLAEEISRMRYFITGQRSDVVSLCNTERAASELETLLRAKENEVQYLKKEISCLQNEVQSLTKEKEVAYERFKEAYVELSDTRGRGQLEMGSLNEHLRLANAALQEGARQT
uniref:PH domain-containing protein n=1 Tax=Oreochromis niloticus TaxID=8128 RepID=I3KNM3_ORENI